MQGLCPEVSGPLQSTRVVLTSWDPGQGLCAERCLPSAAIVSLTSSSPLHIHTAVQRHGEPGRKTRPGKQYEAVNQLGRPDPIPSESQVLHPDSVPTLTLPAPQSLPGLPHHWESLLSTLDNLLPKFPCKYSLPFVHCDHTYYYIYLLGLL